MLRGRDGRMITDHAFNTALCYVLDVSDEYDPPKVRPDADHRCEVYRQIDSLDTMMLCDGCNLGYHMECLTPSILEVPMGELYYPSHPDRAAAHSH